jgi:hypothetical protein
MPQKVRQFQPLWVVAVIKISTIWDVDLLQVENTHRQMGTICPQIDIQFSNLDVVESPAEKAGRLNEDGERRYKRHSVASPLQTGTSGKFMGGMIIFSTKQ